MLVTMLVFAVGVALGLLLYDGLCVLIDYLQEK